MSAEGQTIPDDMAQRVARLINEAEDMRAQAVNDLKTIYGDLREELKSLGWLGQNISKEVAALKGAIAEIRLDDEKKAKRDEKGDRVDDYVSIISKARARAPARTRENIEQFDPLTGEFLDDAPVTIIDQTDADGHHIKVAVDTRSDAGLDIVTKHTEIATNEGGANQEEELAQGSTPDLEPSGPDVNGHQNSPEEANEMDRDEMRGGEAVHSVPAEKGREAIPVGPEGVDLTHAEAGESPAPAFLTKPPSPLRPHCQRPEMCAGVGRTHCHTCTKAMREQEEFA